MFEISRQAVTMVVKNIIQSRIQKSWTSAKQTDDIYISKNRLQKNIKP